MMGGSAFRLTHVEPSRLALKQGRSTIMDILFLAPQPFFEVRGTPLAVRRLLQSLSQRGHSVQLLTYPVGEEVSIPHVDVKRCPGWPGLRKIPIGPSKTKVILDMFLFFMCGKEILWRRYDVIHAVEEGVFLAAPWARLFGVDLVYDMDSNIPDQLKSSGFMKGDCLLKGILMLERWVLKRCKAVLTVCTELSDHARELHGAVQVFQLEDAPLVPSPTASSIRKELGIGVGPMAVYTGNFEPYQGIDLLLASLPKAFAEVQDLTVVLVGGLGDRLDWALEKRAELGIPADRAFILPRRTPEEMEPFLREADIFLSPRSEGGNTPFKVFTYLAAGKPLLATRLSTHTQVLDDQVALLVEATPEGFAEGMIALSRDRDLRHKLGSAGQSYVEDRFGEKAYEEKVSRFLAHLEDG